MPQVGWEILGLTGLVILYISLPSRLRQVATMKGLVFNVTFALTCLAFSLAMVVTVNDYDAVRLGIGVRHLGPSSVVIGGVTLLGVLALWTMTRLAGREPFFTVNMVKLALLYPAWAYVQQLLVLGILVNLLADWLGNESATILGGLAFGVIHRGNRIFFLITLAIGLAYAWCFLKYPNLLPIAVSHAILGTLNFYWIKGQDKWAGIFGRLQAG